MMIHGEIEGDGSMYGAVLEPLAMYGQGKTREAACSMLATVILEHAADHGPLDGFDVAVTDDGEATIYVTSNDPARLTAILLRRMRDLHDLSLADVAKAMNARSRNGWAQYEQGRIDPSLGKLEEMLAVVAPELTLAIIPRTARVIPRWDEEADDIAELDRLVEDPSPESAAALRAKHVAHRAKLDGLRAKLLTQIAKRAPTKHGARAPIKRTRQAKVAIREATKRPSRRPTKRAHPLAKHKTAKAAR